jgi:hypothetical protein
MTVKADAMYLKSWLTPKISSYQICVGGQSGLPLTYTHVFYS